MRKLKCFFCSRAEETRLVDYRVGTTGKRGTYRRRICDLCEILPEHKRQIRGPWRRR